MKFKNLIKDHTLTEGYKQFLKSKYTLLESLKDGHADTHEEKIIDGLVSELFDNCGYSKDKLIKACKAAGMTDEEINAFVITLNESYSESDNNYVNILEVIDSIKNDLDIDPRYDILDLVTYDRVKDDMAYRKLVRTVNEAERFNYHSDYWGSEEEYQNNNIYAMEQLEPYIGQTVSVNYDDGQFELVKVIGLLIDRQYNSITHTDLLVEPISNSDTEQDGSTLNEAGIKNWFKSSVEDVKSLLNRENKKLDGIVKTWAVKEFDDNKTLVSIKLTNNYRTAEKIAKAWSSQSINGRAKIYVAEIEEKYNKALTVSNKHINKADKKTWFLISIFEDGKILESANYFDDFINTINNINREQSVSKNKNVTTIQLPKEEQEDTEKNIVITSTEEQRSDNIEGTSDSKEQEDTAVEKEEAIAEKEETVKEAEEDTDKKVEQEPSVNDITKKANVTTNSTKKVNAEDIMPTGEKGRKYTGAQLTQMRKNNATIVKALENADMDVSHLYIEATNKKGLPYSKASKQLNQLRKDIFGESLEKSKSKVNNILNESLINDWDYLQWSDVDENEPYTDEVGKCSKCGTKLNDGGTCPKCYDGDEDMTDEEFYEALGKALCENNKKQNVSGEGENIITKFKNLIKEHRLERKAEDLVYDYIQFLKKWGPEYKENFNELAASTIAALAIVANKYIEDKSISDELEAELARRVAEGTAEKDDLNESISDVVNNIKNAIESHKLQRDEAILLNDFSNFLNKYGKKYKNNFDEFSDSMLLKLKEISRQYTNNSIAKNIEKELLSRTSMSNDQQPVDAEVNTDTDIEIDLDEGLGVFAAIKDKLKKAKSKYLEKDKQKLVNDFESFLNELGEYSPDMFTDFTPEYLNRLYSIAVDLSIDNVRDDIEKELTKRGLPVKYIAKTKINKLMNKLELD